MLRTFKKTILIFFFCVFPFTSGIAQDEPHAYFSGKLNDNNINLRADSSVTSKIICTLNKGEELEVILEKFGWYRVKLPKTAPAFVKKTLFASIDGKTAKAIKENINIRLEPNEASNIIGKVNKEELVVILKEEGDWYKISPTDKAFGWINKKFVDKVAPEEKTQGEKEKLAAKSALPENTEVVLEGIIQPYKRIMNRTASHKLITREFNVYLLKGDKVKINNLAYHKVKVTGKTISSSDQKYPLIEVIKLESLN